MKKILLLLAFAGIGLSVSAQESADEPKKVRSKFFNINYVYEKIKPTDSSFDFSDIGDEVGGIANDKIEGLKNNWGISLTRGRSYMLHKKPIARLISIGIDASFFDVTYSNYTFDPAKFGGSSVAGDESIEGVEIPEIVEDASTEGEDTSTGSFDLHKMEYSFQVGPSITITPGQDFTIAAYARFAPTFAAYYAEKSFGGNYASMFITGASITYRKVGFGIEARMGSCKYKNFSGDLDLSGTKIKSSGFRAYLQLRW